MHGFREKRGPARPTHRQSTHSTGSCCVERLYLVEVEVEVDVDVDTLVLVLVVKIRSRSHTNARSHPPPRASSTASPRR
jgi:hypothetical protein